MSSNEDRLGEKAGVVVVARVLTTLIDLALALALVRLLSKTEFAIVSFLFLAYQGLRGIATLGFPESIFYFYERVAHGARRRLVWQTVLLLLASSTVTAGILVGLGALVPTLLSAWTPEQQEAVQRYMPLMAAVAMLEIPTWLFDNVMLAAGKERASAWYQLLTSAASFLGLIGPILLGYGLEVGLYGLLVYAALRALGSFGWMAYALPRPTEVLPEGLLREQLRFSVPLGLQSVANRLNKQADKFVVSLILPAAALANYTVAAQEIPIVTAVPYAIGSVLMSRYVQRQLAGDKEGVKELWYWGIEKVSLVVVPVTIFFIAAAADFVVALFGPEYLPAVLPFQIYSLIMLRRVAQYGSLLQAFGDTRSILRFTAILLVTNVALTVPFTYAMGTVGTALATLLASLLSWYLYLRRIGQLLEIPLREVLPFGFYTRTVLLAAACGAATWALRYLLLDDLNAYLGLLVQAPVYLVLFGTTGTLFGLITREDWRQVLDWLRPKVLFR